MDNDSVSYWSDIKRYEDILANDPGSYCFTLLSEVYRKLGLLDDAIEVAQRGIGVHPEYAGGYMALGRAYFEKGMKEESREALERVARVTPDNLLAQKMLCQIYLDQGDTGNAIRALKVIDLLNPGDVESRLLLESLEHSGGGDEAESGTGFSAAFAAGPEASETVSPVAAREDEYDDAELIHMGDEEREEHTAVECHLASATLAELYLSQGFTDRAVDVYRQLLDEQPENPEFRNRMAQLQDLEEGPDARNGMPEPEPRVAETDSGLQREGGEPPREMRTRVSEQERVINILESWLENIRRGRCQ